MKTFNELPDLREIDTQAQNFKRILNAVSAVLKGFTIAVNSHINAFLKDAANSIKNL
jgi:hypothetical protein